MGDKTANYRDQLLNTLRTRDPEALKEFIVNSGRELNGAELPSDDSMWELAMHLMIAQAPELADLQNDSDDWILTQENRRGTPNAFKRKMGQRRPNIGRYLPTGMKPPAVPWSSRLWPVKRSGGSC